MLIEKLKLTIKKLRHEQFGQSSERGALLDQLELQLADLEENAAQAETAAQMATAEKITVPSFERRKPARRPLPEHLPRERIVYPVPATCPCCGDSRLRKIGEDVTETLELIPRQWKVIQHVREKLVCRACEAITQPLSSGVEYSPDCGHRKFPSWRSCPDVPGRAPAVRSVRSAGRPLPSELIRTGAARMVQLGELMMILDLHRQGLSITPSPGARGATRRPSANISRAASSRRPTGRGRLAGQASWRPTWTICVSASRPSRD